MKQEPKTTSLELGTVKVAPSIAKGTLSTGFMLSYFFNYHRPHFHGFYFRPSWR